MPVTVRPPELPVLASMMPGLAPLDEMLWNVRPLEPMVVLSTSRRRGGVVSVLPVPVAVTVPPPVAENAVLVSGAERSACRRS